MVFKVSACEVYSGALHLIELDMILYLSTNIAVLPHLPDNGEKDV